MNINTAVDQVEEHINSLKLKLDRFKVELRAELNKIFDENPQVISIGWQGGVPYFNDGSRCLFGIYDVIFEVTSDDDTVVEQSLYGDEPVIFDEDGNILNDLCSFLADNKDIIEIMFDDSHQTKITRNNREEVIVEDFYPDN